MLYKHISKYLTFDHFIKMAGHLPPENKTKCA